MEHDKHRNQRGIAGIEAAHSGVTDKDEIRVDRAISSLYKVDKEEAAEIHANYHANRIFLGLMTLARKNGMKDEILSERIRNFDFLGLGERVAAGSLTEAAAVDLLFRNLSILEGAGRIHDRYLSFYA